MTPVGPMGYPVSRNSGGAPVGTPCMRENRVRSLALDFKAMARTRGESHRRRIVSCGFTVAHSDFSGQTTFETSQTGHPGNRICQVVASQNFVSEDVVAYCDTALITK
jgi:hypothetical protein